MSEIKLILGDCLEVMKTIPDNSVDLVVTSPPYDNLRVYKGYTFNFEGIAKELFRIIKQCGVVVWVVGDQTINGSESGTSFRQALYFKEVGFNLHDTMIWERRTTPQNSNRYEPDFEYMFVFSKKSPKTFNPLREKRKYNDMRLAKNYHRDSNDESKFKKHEFCQQEMVVLGNVWHMTNRGNDNIAHNHPAIFPEKLAQCHILSWSNEGDTVLDPMMGSGTVGKMAKLNKRNFIGIEISPEYFKIAEKRINNTSELML